MQSKFVSKLSFITLNFAYKDCKVFIGTSCKRVFALALSAFTCRTSNRQSNKSGRYRTKYSPISKVSGFEMRESNHKKSNCYSNVFILAAARSRLSPKNGGTVQRAMTPEQGARILDRSYIHISPKSERFPGCHIHFPDTKDCPFEFIVPTGGYDAR